jgi:hypothetical protein
MPELPHGQRSHSPPRRKAGGPWVSRLPRLPGSVQKPGTPSRPAIPDTPGKEVPAPGQLGFDPRRVAREAQDRFKKPLGEVKELLPKLTDKKIEAAVKSAVNRWEHEFDALVEQGTDASPSQVLVVVIISKEPEDEVQASEAQASEEDKKILQHIERELVKAHVPFWTALASLGKVKEWSASLEISAGLFAVKGTGGISVTFGS